VCGGVDGWGDVLAGGGGDGGVLFCGDVCAGGGATGGFDERDCAGDLFCGIGWRNADSPRGAGECCGVFAGGDLGCGFEPWALAVGSVSAGAAGSGGVLCVARGVYGSSAGRVEAREGTGCAARANACAAAGDAGAD